MHEDLRAAFVRYLFVTLIVSGVLVIGQQATVVWKKYGCLPANGIVPNGLWLNSCASDQIGDLSREGIWFGLTPRVTHNIESAEALFFGDSKLLYALSKSGASEWFHTKGYRVFFLAFEGGEQSGWGSALLQKFPSHPKVVIVDADPYFTGEMTGPSQALLSNDAQSRASALSIRRFLSEGTRHCSISSWLCGHTEKTYRRVSDGSVVWLQPDLPISMKLTRPPAPDLSQYPRQLLNARKFFSHVDLPSECIVITLVPSGMQNDTVARRIAHDIGASFVAPDVTGLSTVDTLHLTRASAMRWTSAFISQLKPILDRCAGRNILPGRQ